MQALSECTSVHCFCTCEQAVVKSASRHARRSARKELANKRRKLRRTSSFTFRHRQRFSLAARREEGTETIDQKKPRYQELDTERGSNKATNGNAGTGNELAAETFTLSGTNSPKEAAVALATTICQERRRVLTDSAAACKNFQKPYLRCRTDDTKHTKRSYRLGATRRKAGVSPTGDHVPTTVSKRYRYILEHYRLGTRKYPPFRPHLVRRRQCSCRNFELLPKGHLMADDISNTT